MFRREIIIELAKYSDAPEIASMSRDLVEDGLGWNWKTKRVNASIKARNTNVAVARKGSILIGFGIMTYGEDKANLNLLAVKERYRRKGIGTRIINWLLLVASTAGIFNIYVQVRESNVIAQDLYLKLGFVVLEKRIGYYRRKEIGVMMFNHTAVIQNDT